MCLITPRKYKHLKRLFLLSKQLLTVESSHAAGTSRGNGLSVSLVLDITSGKDTLDGGVGGTGDGNNIALLVGLDLALDDGGGGDVTNGVEQTVDLEVSLLAGQGVLDLQGVQQLAVSLGLDGHVVEENLDLGVGGQSLGHNGGSSQLVLSDNDVDLGAVLGEEEGLLSGRVSSSDNGERLVSENGDSTVTDSAGRDTLLPVLVLTGQRESLGRGTSGKNNGVGSVGLLVLIELGPVLEGSLGQIDLGDGLGDDLGAESDGLLSHVLHELGAHDSVGEAGEVLNLSGSGELTAGSNAVGHHSLVESGLDLGSRKVDGSGVGGGAGTDDNNWAVGHSGLSCGGERGLGVFNCGCRYGQ